MRSHHCVTLLRLLLVCLLCAAACGDPLPLTNDDSQVVVTEKYRACSNDSDCVLASTSCNGCCERDAITSDLADEFDRERTKSCSGYEGPVCDCVFLPLAARCIDDRCETEATEEGPTEETPTDASAED
jgi:iron only hydrogenase large subunit-like protein